MRFNNSSMALLGIPDLPDRAFIRKAGGGIIPQGGGSQPTNTTSTTNTSNIPAYAQPYVETMLGATQQQLFKTTPGGTDSNGNQIYNINGFQPYQAYGSTNPDGTPATPTQAAQAAVAGFSPLQQQAQSSAANLQTPGQYGQAEDVTGMGIGQSMGYANQMNQLANSATPQNFQQQVGGYMNPYLQQSLAPSLQLLNQQYGQQAAQEQGSATQAGAFGGSREAVMNALNSQNQNLAQQQMIGNAYNNAFGAAQNQYNQNDAFQLQGLQAGLGATNQAMQGANQLANIGGQNLAAQQSILGTQAQQGQLQQANQQQVINQAIQNYSNAQQYPLMELGMMSNMLHGLPMQSTTTNQYQAAPNSILQGIGAGGAAASIYNSLNPQSKKKGGITEAVPRHYAGVLASLNNELEDIAATDPSALAKYASQTKSPELKRLIQEKAGIPLAPTNMGGAAPSGGIVALAEGGVPKYGTGDVVTTPGDRTGSLTPEQVQAARALANSVGNVELNGLPNGPSDNSMSDISQSEAPRGVPVNSLANVTPTQALQKQLAPPAAIQASTADTSSTPFNLDTGVQPHVRGNVRSPFQGVYDTVGDFFSNAGTTATNPRLGGRPAASTPTPGGIAQATPAAAPSNVDNTAPNAGLGVRQLTPQQGAALQAQSASVMNPQGAGLANTPEAKAAEAKAVAAAAPKEKLKQTVLAKETSTAKTLAKDEDKAVKKLDEAAESNDFMPKNYGTDVKSYTDDLKKAIGLGPDSYKKMDALNKAYEDQVLGMDKQAYIMRNLNAAQTFGKLANFRGPVGAGIAAAMGDFASSEANLQDKMQAMKMEALKGQAEIEKGKRAEELGLWTLAAQHYDKASEIAANLKATKMKGDIDLKVADKRAESDMAVTKETNASREKTEGMRVASEAASAQKHFDAATYKEAQEIKRREAYIPALRKELGREPTQAEVDRRYTESNTPAAESNESRLAIARGNAFKDWLANASIYDQEYGKLKEKGDVNKIRAYEEKIAEKLSRGYTTSNTTAPQSTLGSILVGTEKPYNGKTYVFQGGDPSKQENWKVK